MSERVGAINGGCWFCETANDGMYFSVEFDCSVHRWCIREELRKTWPGCEPNPEAEIFYSEFNMTNEPLAIWADALDSGLFKQGYGCLLRGDCYCCLGVACEAYNRYSGKPPVEITGTHLPREVRRWLKLESDNGALGMYPGDGGTLIDVNDLAKWNFVQIATLIQEGKLRTTR